MGVRHGQDDELDMAPFSGCNDDVAQCRNELRLMRELELFVVDVEPNEHALHRGLEVRTFEERAELVAKELITVNYKEQH